MGNAQPWNSARIKTNNILCFSTVAKGFRTLGKEHNLLGYSWLIWIARLKNQRLKTDPVISFVCFIYISSYFRIVKNMLLFWNLFCYYDYKNEGQAELKQLLLPFYSFCSLFVWNTTTRSYLGSKLFIFLMCCSQGSIPFQNFRAIQCWSFVFGCYQYL